MRATLYLISQSYVSGRTLRGLMDGLCAATDGPSRAVRLERDGAGLWQALSALASDGATEITLRPVGLPFSQSLLAWLPGAAGEWLTRGEAAGMRLHLAEDVACDAGVLARIARAPVSSQPILPRVQGSHGKGWDRPPAHRHHILVCTGPRCHLRDAPDLLGLLKAELNRLFIGDDCLVTATGCLFPCNAGPTVVVYPAGRWFRLPDATAVRRFAETVLQRNQPLPDYETFNTGDLHEPA
ncbi:(2Fe-2S) ferredoxin domain-containing protein [Thalassorhabdomicrobium marinisediminis]|uniref:(2Fe-2S) ferredoxin domain-containing protein n=1 Tax=Thalassorhabdomicrobium marinisediminis TaxID=2170577 RepID=UPI002492ECD4|nr:(2Fe-2S) ferredoxin domain-containing protein [Thalassorhabdomicrobium marinisediminis]